MADIEVLLRARYPNLLPKRLWRCSGNGARFWTEPLD
jgi:hypothetical protein